MEDSKAALNSDQDLYQTNFDTETYLGNCYKFADSLGQKDNSQFVMFVLRQLSQTFSSGQYKGNRLIEVGTGPTIHTLISACEYFEEIVVSDYTDSNRQELEKWLKAEEGCFNWDAHIQCVCDLEGKRTPTEVTEFLRQRTRQVLKCDLTLDNPFDPVTVEPADCLISSLCLEAACKDQEAYRHSLGAMVGLLRPGGVLVLIGDIGETFYTVGKQAFSCVTLSQDFLEQTWSELGLSVQEFTLQPAHERQSDLKCDYEASFYLVALKL